jgi:hypothetical protein
MKLSYITFRSVTYAQKAERILKKAGLECTLQRTPKELSVRGCGYCLGLHPGQVGWAAQLLDAEKVDYGKLYASTAEGYEELHL